MAHGWSRRLAGRRAPRQATCKCSSRCGWCSQPVTGHLEPGLVFFTTNDNYAAGSYAWNVEPGSPFVQTNNLWALTGALAPLSIVGRQQRVLSLASFLTDGNWWMYAGGKAAANAIGYVPGSWWNNGPLTTESTGTEFGGEVAGYTQNDGIRRFGGMGSGRRVGNGTWRHVAYIRHMQYFDTLGFAQVMQAERRRACYLHSPPIPATAPQPKCMLRSGTPLFFMAALAAPPVDSAGRRDTCRGLIAPTV